MSPCVAGHRGYRAAARNLLQLASSAVQVPEQARRLVAAGQVRLWLAQREGAPARLLARKGGEAVPWGREGAASVVTLPLLQELAVRLLVLLLQPLSLELAQRHRLLHRVLSHGAAVLTKPLTPSAGRHWSDATHTRRSCVQRGRARRRNTRGELPLLPLLLHPQARQHPLLGAPLRAAHDLQTMLQGLLARRGLRARQ